MVPKVLVFTLAAPHVVPKVVVFTGVAPLTPFGNYKVTMRVEGLLKSAGVNRKNFVLDLCLQNKMLA